MLEGLQRRALLHVICGNRTISITAGQVIAGLPLLTLLVEERARLYYRVNGNRVETKKSEWHNTIEKWQTVWSSLKGTAA